MVTTFSTTSTNVLSGQPNSAGEKLILRSTSSSDTMNVTITGTVSGSPDSETIALVGRTEVQTTKSFSHVTSITLASAATGIVTMYGQGVAGKGDIRVDTVPAIGSTITLGLTGDTVTGSFFSPARFTIQTVAFASLGQGDYINVLYDGTTKRFWFDKDAAGTGAPSNPGGGLYKVSIVTGDTAAQVATKLNTSFVTNLTEYVTSILTSTITATRVNLGTGSVTDGSGGAATTFTLTTVQAGTSGDSQIRTTYHTDGVAITTAQVAANIRSWINGGVTFQDGVGLNSTFIDPSPSYISATVLTTVVTITDLLAIGRQLVWANTQSASYLTLRSITGASTSLAQATFRNTVTQLLTAAISLNTEDRTTATLPAGITPTCDWVLVGGKKFTIALSAAQTASALAFKYQTSQDRLTARDGDTSISITTTSATLSNRDKLINPSENAEYVRLVVTSNPNTLDTKVNAKLIA